MTLRIGKDRILDILAGLSVLMDILIFGSAALLAYYLRLETDLFSGLPMVNLREDYTLSDYSGHFAFGIALLFFIFLYRGLYSKELFFKPRAITLEIVKSCAYWFFIYLFYSLFFRFTPPISRGFVLLNAVIAIPLLCIGRITLYKWLTSSAWGPKVRNKIVFVGWSEKLSHLVDAIRKDAFHPYQISGWIRTDASLAPSDQEAIPLLGDLDGISDLLGQPDGPEIVILADPDMDSESIENLINVCCREQVHFKLLGSFLPLFTSGLRVQTISNVPLLAVQELPIEKWQNRFIKRGLDIIGSIVGLLISLPLFIVFSILVKLESPGPVIYRQTRCGRRNQPFEIYKIRSMQLDAEKDGSAGWSTRDDNRRLKVGSFMRRWNIDEVPQFWNVLKGEMSLVGPRPERPELIQEFKYNIRLYNIRHGVKPGLTGWAQIHGWRGDTSLEERIRHDLYYMENWSIWMDIQIMLLTLIPNKNAY